MTEAVPPEVPRANGELAFDAPWESRAFGLAAVYLGVAGRGLGPLPPPPDGAIAEAPPDTRYYEAWVTALERLLAGDGVLVTAP